MGGWQSKEENPSTNAAPLLDDDQAAVVVTPEASAAPHTPQAAEPPTSITTGAADVGNAAPPPPSQSCWAGCTRAMKRIAAFMIKQRRRHNLERDFDWARRPFIRSFIFVMLLFIPLACGANIAGFVVVMTYLPKEFAVLGMPDFEHNPHLASLGKAIGWFFAFPICAALFVYRPMYAVLTRDDSTSSANSSSASLAIEHAPPPAASGLAAPTSVTSSVNHHADEGPSTGAPWVLSVVPPDVDIPKHLEWRRQLWASLAFAFLSAAIVVCGMAVVGVERLGFCGVLFLLNLHKSVTAWCAEIQEPDSTQRIFFKLAGGCIVAMQCWFLLAVLLLRRWWAFARAMFRSRAWAPIVAGVVVFGGLIALYVVSIVFVPDATTNVRAPTIGARQLCFKNSCGEPIWVGQIGGSTGINCPGCPPGTICNAEGDGLCHFMLPLATPLQLASGDQHCMTFNYDPVLTNIYPKTGGIVRALVQWSGSIYASGGCNAKGECETALCIDCPPYRGPTGPVTQAEMTLQVHGKDYYDITIINGANFPMSIAPIDEGLPFAQESDVPPEYVCGRPGATHANQHEQTLATWSFTQPPSFIGSPLGAPTTYALVSGGSGSPCPCANGETCGLAMKVTSDGLPLNNVTGPQCGKLVGVWTDDELCGWTDAISYGWCKQLVPTVGTSTFEEMFQCTGTPYSTSCFQNVATDACCGCENWPSMGLASSMECYGRNAEWQTFAQPRLEFLKKACPTCYTYPFDDATSLFTCRSNTSLNLNSYTIEWCPGGVEMQYQAN